MLRLCYSNRTERLLEALVADVGELRRTRGPLEPVCLVVPNRNIETYVRFGFAAQTGIAANLQASQLRRFAASLLGQGPSPVQVVDAETLTGHLLELLLDDALLSDPALAPVRAYVEGGGGTADARDLRRLQLAERLGRLYEEYSFSREGMLAAWPSGPVLSQTPLAQTEAWQRALWLRLFSREGLLAQRTRNDGVARVHLGALVPLLEQGALELPPRIHLFGVSHVAPLFQRILAALSARTALHVYTLNPCREFWEDVGRRPARLGPAALDGEDPFGLLRDQENPALRLWGKPGRENVRLLNELADCDFAEAFEAPEATTLLGRLQQQILDRAPLPEVPPQLPADASIRVLACPGVRREAEAVAEEIWALVQEDAEVAREAGRPPLRFNEIAVIVAGRDREDHFTQLSAAFRDCHDIPHNLVDLELSRVSRVAEAAGRLLQLPLGQLTRPELLGVLTHPCARAQAPGVDPQLWVRWCERLEVIHGGDRRDHAGSYVDGDVLNWDQGLRRLGLGAFMGGERSGEDRPFPVGEELYLPEEHDRAHQLAAARLAMAARALIADARFAREARLTLAEWATFFDALLAAHLQPTDAAEEQELAQCQAALRALAALDVGERALSYALAHGLATRALASLPGGRGQHLADGVVISTSQPMRAIPFRAVFIVGLGEGHFPATDRRNPLDLRAARPQPGDVSPREQDRYLFLEALLCARDRVTLSYVARNPVSGEALEPSPVVHELLQLLERGQLGPGRREELILRYPLRRHLPPTRAEAPLHRPGAITFAEVARERAAVALRQAYLAAHRAPPPPPSRLAPQVAPEAWPQLAAQLGLTLPEALVAARPGRLVVPLAALRRFLECPLQGHARHQLRLQGHDDDSEAPEERDEERFASSALEATVRLRELFLQELSFPAGRAERDLAAPLRAQMARLARAGRVPLGVFGEAEVRQHQQILQAWQQQLLASPLRAAPLAVFGFGGSPEHARVDQRHPALQLEVELRPPQGPALMARVELAGTLAPLGTGPWGSLLLKAGNAPSDSGDALAMGVGALVDQLVLAAAGLSTAPHRVQLLFGDGEARTLQLPALEPQAARAQLSAIASDLLSGGHGHLLPCEAVLAVFGPEPSGVPFAEAVEELRQNPRARLSSRRGPIADLEPFAPLDHARAQALALRRFGHYLQVQLEVAA